MTTTIPTTPRLPPSAATTRNRISAAIGATLHQRTSDARRLTLEAAVAGDTASIAYLKTEAAWFPDSTANQFRAHTRPPSSDAEIQAEAARYLTAVYGVVAQSPARTTPREASAGWAAAFNRANGTPRVQAAKPLRILGGGVS